MDKCYQIAEQVQSENVHDYNTYNFYPTNSMSCAPTFNQVMDFSYPNYLNVSRDGNFAGGQCRVNNDSKLRNDKCWNKSRERTQLPARIFQAVPDLSTGVNDIDVNNRLVIGKEDSRVRRSCNVLSEVSTLANHLTPLVPCLRDTIQSPEHIVFPQGKYQHFGVNSRDINRQREFLRCQGYDYSKGCHVWKKPRK